MGGSSISNLADALKAWYPADGIARIAYDNQPFIRYLRGEVDAQMLEVKRRLAEAMFPVTGPPAIDHAAVSLQVGIGAAVALGGLGWIIARRNQLAAEADDETFLAMLRDWVTALWQRFLAAIAMQPKALPEHTEQG